MSNIRPYILILAPLIAAASTAVWADCVAESSAYESAKQSFVGDAEAIYHVTVPSVVFALADREVATESPALDQADLSVLSEASRRSVLIAAEMNDMVHALTASVNSLFLKRRSIPQVFSAGAALSLCLSGVERAAFEHLTAVLAEKSAEPDKRKTTCIEQNVEDLTEDLTRQTVDIKNEPAVAEIMALRDQETDPVRIDVHNFLIALSIAAPHLAGAVECMTLDPDATAETMAMAMQIFLPVGFSMRDRKSLQDEFRKAFGKELDLGLWEMNEVAE